MAKRENKEAQPKEQPREMSLEEARAYRASLHKPEERTLSEQEKREQFRLFWAREKQKYGKSKNLEQILWVHLQSVKLDDPKKFEEGIKHFGLQKVR